MATVVQEGDNKHGVLTKCRLVWNMIEYRRNVVAFWIFGMATNFVFIISLSAAHDILDPKMDKMTVEQQTNLSEISNHTKYENIGSYKEDTHILFCNPTGTGAVLLSSIIPELILKLIVQFCPKDISYCFKVGITVISGSMCFILFAFGNHVWLRMLGVVSAGVAFGLGETTFVPLTSFYDKSTVSAWSSGTGAAGLLATLLYAGLMSIGVSRVTFMMAMLVVPALIAVTYIFMLKPDISDTDSTGTTESSELVKKSASNESLTLKERVQILPSLFKYVFSLGVSYLTVYFINQGLTELLYFNDQIITRPEQYRWYQVVYRIGVFISRLGLKVLIINNLWVSPLVLCGIVTILTFQVFERFIPYLWAIMLIVFLNGFLNGVAYVSTFMHATNKFESSGKEFTLGVITLSGPIGILLAGVIATPFHDYVCSLKLRI